MHGHILGVRKYEKKVAINIGPEMDSFQDTLW